MRVPTFRSSMILAILPLAALLAVAGPSFAQAPPTCASDYPEALAIKVDCSKCKPSTGGSCEIKLNKEANITVESKPEQGKKLDLCWEVTWGDGDAPDGSTVTISARSGQSKAQKKLFKDSDIEFPARQIVEHSGKVKVANFKKVEKKGMAEWRYDMQVELDPRTICVVDPRVCIREAGGDPCDS